MKTRALLRTAPAIVLAALAVALLPSAAAAAPPNDNFPGATITLLPFTDTVDTAGATHEPGEPFCGPSRGLAVWYSLTPTSDMVVRVDLTGSAFGVFVSVYTGSSLADITCVKDGLYNPPPDEYNLPAVFQAEAGATYYLQAGSQSPPQTGVLTFDVSVGTPPANDDFAGTTITGIPFTNSVDTTFATDDGQASAIGPTVWYNYTPDEDVELWADTLDSDYNAVIHLRDFEGDAPSGADQEYWDCEIIDQGLYFRARAGETLYFQVGGRHIGDTGDAVFKLREYDGSPELVCWGEMGPPYDGYTNYPHPTPTPMPDGGGGGQPTPTPERTPISLPAGGGDPPTHEGGRPVVALAVGGALAVLASGALLVRVRRR